MLMVISFLSNIPLPLTTSPWSAVPLPRTSLGWHWEGAWRVEFPSETRLSKSRDKEGRTEALACPTSPAVPDQSLTATNHHQFYAANANRSSTREAGMKKVQKEALRGPRGSAQKQGGGGTTAKHRPSLPFAPGEAGQPRAPPAAPPGRVRPQGTGGERSSFPRRCYRTLGKTPAMVIIKTPAT